VIFVDGDTKVEESRKVGHVCDLVSGTGFEWGLVSFQLLRGKKVFFIFFIFSSK